MQQQTMSEFVKSAGVTMTAERTDENPNMPDVGRRDMDHWRVVLKAGRSRMTTHFSMGFGHNGVAPTVESVLSCLASDASSADESFEDFCANLGYDTDSRKAERIYNVTKKQTARLRKFLGELGFETLLYHTEQE